MCTQQKSFGIFFWRVVNGSIEDISVMLAMEDVVQLGPFVMNCFAIKRGLMRQALMFLDLVSSSIGLIASMLEREFDAQRCS